MDKARTYPKWACGVASAVMTRSLVGCSSPQTVMDAQTDSGMSDALNSDVPQDVPMDIIQEQVVNDVPSMDSGMDFPMRNLPPLPLLRSRISEIGPLGDPNADGVRLPTGFRSRVVARAGMRVVTSSPYNWHTFPDGGATYQTEDGGWIYVSNSEMPTIGGVGAIRFSSDGTIQSAYPILRRSNVNCAGGKTPWHTWLSCEEVSNGRVFECDPWGQITAIVRPALGIFKHEAAAVDPIRGYVYLTEDESDGRFYRFAPERRTPEGYPVLTAGSLEVAVVAMDQSVTWVAVPDPLFEGATPTRLQVASSTLFNGGEGIWYHDDTVYFTTKGDNRLWAYDVVRSRLTVIYDRATSPTPILRGVDNITVTCCGDVLVAEDGGSMQIVAVLPDGSLKPLVQVVGQDTSEITGPAFDPSGTRLYFSSQRGASSGITYEIEGPFHSPA